MLVLDSPNLKLEAVLGGAVAANQPSATVCFVTHDNNGQTSKPSMYRVALNSTTDVVILPAPSIQGQVREILGIYLYNKDTANVTYTVKTDDGTTEHILMQQLTSTLKTFYYEPGAGWTVT